MESAGTCRGIIDRHRRTECISGVGVIHTHAIALTVLVQVRGEFFGRKIAAERCGARIGNIEADAINREHVLRIRLEVI